MSAQLELQLVGNQRWRDQRDSYRPAGEVIQTSRYAVAAIDETTAKLFILRHHYLGCYPAARWRFGLFRGGALVGVAVFSHPCNDLVLTNVFGGKAKESVELGRFVLLDDVPGNGETWFLARCFELLDPEHLRGVLSFSDPMPRRSLLTDQLVTPGHIGTIYQAFNGTYLGRGAAQTLRLLANGQVLSNRALSKIRGKERGFEYAVAQMVAAGAPVPGNGLRRWLKTWLPRVTRRVRHHGNHRFAWVPSPNKSMQAALELERAAATQAERDELRAARRVLEQQLRALDLRQRGLRADLKARHDDLPDHLRTYPKARDPEPSASRPGLLSPGATRAPRSGRPWRHTSNRTARLV